ncbi:MAG: gluconate 2-dehydrogenase subunit 3 family protein [Saprospiraceae bacterium]|nr:gluconate 2-dehydrogenase subunit 3 family protein [Saprospiraceae bacterium]
MHRRELLQRTSLLIGGTLLGADSLLAKNISWDAMEADDIPAKGIGLFTKQQIKVLSEIAEAIIPTTDTPGAKAAKVGQFMAVIVSDCYEPVDQSRFMEGLAKLDDGSKKRHGKAFLKCNSKLRMDYLLELDSEQKAFQKSKKTEEPSHYFRVIKDLVLWGYFTSEIGATQALRFLEYPGKYTTVDYKKGERNWGGY